MKRSIACNSAGRSGTRPSAIRVSYAARTGAVMSVAIIPGRTSYTCIPDAARRVANNRTAIASPAFETQYSPRAMEAISAETDVTNTIDA